MKHLGSNWFRWSHEGKIPWWDKYPYKKRVRELAFSLLHVRTQGEGTCVQVRRWILTEEPNCLTPQTFWISSLQNCDKWSSVVQIPPGSVILFWQPKQANTMCPPREHQKTFAKLWKLTLRHNERSPWDWINMELLKYLIIWRDLEGFTGFPGSSAGKESACNPTLVGFLGGEDPLEKG